MESITFSNGPNSLAANLYLPAGVSLKQKYPAIVCVHPAGGVKEQTCGIYATRLTAQGFITLAFDASYQGESEGEPRQLENPYTRVEDISAAIDYLTTLDYIDRERIGVLGICAGGAYAVCAALSDRRIKAIGTVSAANYGDIMRYGWDGTDQLTGAQAMLSAAAHARTEEARGGEMLYFPIAPMTREEAPNADLAEATEYYRTARAQYPTSPSKAPVRSLMQLCTFDAFHLTEIFLTQPLLIVAGEQAGTRWMSEALYRKAASKDKSLYLVSGGSHIGMYDKPQLVDDAMSKLGPFFSANLKS